MLVLSRKSNESIIINGNIEVIILGVEGENVKLGIQAPKEVDIYRKEIYLNIQAANREAVQKAIPLNEMTKLLKEMPDFLK
ncbi:carbon storage regulator CsrA [Paenibacillus sp. sgz302251]|uniref:carbon storage regulator CsrA n=1 Tax=Paenibacillus sp. sgz302251 TaxID=3414493 RepID=UPI003C7E9BBC